MAMPTTKQELEEIMKERAVLIVRMREIEATMSELRSRMRECGGRLPSRTFDDMNNMLRERARTEARLTELKQWIREHQLLRKGKQLPDGVPASRIDAYALENALSEPLMLLRYAHRRLKTMLPTKGFRDGDHDLLDSIGDYLFRMGVFVTKAGD